MVYLTKLKHTGSVISSSDQFGVKMFEVAERFFSNYQRGIFIGTGSGVVAQYFMQTPIPFSFVEKHPAFVKQFHVRFGSHTPLLAKDFFTLPINESEEGLGNCLMVSCMPVTGPFYSEKLVEQFRDALNSGSTIVQMSYTPFIRQIRLFERLQQEGFHVKRVSTVFFNIPPASVFVLKKA
jgi:phospholipid N-methyltransferase